MEDVQAPAVGHADRHRLHAELGRLVDGLLEPWTGPAPPARTAWPCVLLRESFRTCRPREAPGNLLALLVDRASLCVSMRSRSQLHRRGPRCAWTVPDVPAVRRGAAQICRSVCTGLSSLRKPFMRHVPRKNSRSKSASVNPYSAGSSSIGALRASRANGSSVAIEWPFTWYARTRSNRRMDS